MKDYCRARLAPLQLEQQLEIGFTGLIISEVFLIKLSTVFGHEGKREGNYSLIAAY